jgi:hypothetical protein
MQIGWLFRNEIDEVGANMSRVHEPVLIYLARVRVTN